MYVKIFERNASLDVVWERPPMDECPDVLFGTETSVPKVTGYTVEWKEASETWDDAQSTTIASLNTRRGIRSLNPNPPMDGVRTAEGG